MRAGDGEPGLLEADHNPQDQALPRSHEVDSSVQIEDTFVRGQTMLAGIDAIQKRFLRGCCLTEEDALVFFNLAPL